MYYIFGYIPIKYFQPYANFFYFDYLHRHPNVLSDNGGCSENRANRILDHNYACEPYKIKFPPYFAYADDVDFICENQQEAEDIVKTATAIFRHFNLFINPETKQNSPRWLRVAPTQMLFGALRSSDAS